MEKQGQKRGETCEKENRCKLKKIGAEMTNRYKNKIQLQRWKNNFKNGKSAAEDDTDKKRHDDEEQ